jgi:rod shape-determining protein MreB and related proteins
MEVAVDLGTANTLIQVKGRGIVLNEPSVVAIERATGNVRAIGLEAKRMLGRTPEGIIAIRPMRDGVIADVDRAELLLRHFLERILPKGFFRTRPRVVIGVPSGITEMERRAVRSAVMAAGAKEVFLLSEPMAAAIGVGLPVVTPRGSMVVNIGGGTTEIGVIALSGIVADASIRIAGNELDDAIMAFIRKHYNLLIGEATAENVKIQIGAVISEVDNLEMEINGRDLISGIPKTIRISSDEIYPAIQEPVQAIVGAVRRALEITPPELSSDIVDEGIVLTGGGAMLRGLAELIHRETGLPIHVDPDSLTSVVRGAGVVLEEWEKYQGVLSR